MLPLRDILKVRRMMEQTGDFDAALDRQDNVYHRNYLGGYIPQNDVSDKPVEVNLGYEVGEDGDLRIVQR